MKRQAVIDKLKDGGEIIYSRGFTSSAHFYTGETVNIATVLNLQEQGLVETRESEKSYGLYYITWREQKQMKVIRVEFEDQQQDLLWWDIRVKDGPLEVGEVVDCGPYHKDLYTGCKVFTPAPYQVGDKLNFASLKGEPLTLRYPIIKVTERK